MLGVLIGAFEASRFDTVIIADKRRPASFDAILGAAVSVAPWVAEKVRYAEEDFTTPTTASDGTPHGGLALLPKGCAVCCVHGCNALTDSVIETAVRAHAESLVVMPCCYAHCPSAEAAPAALRKGMGVALAADVERTYALERAGFDVEWRHVPSLITPMNRLLCARRGGASR